MSDVQGPPEASLTRRAALVRLLGLPLSAAVPAVLVGCSREPHCNETGNLSADDAHHRSEIAAYVEKSPDPAKRCALCVQFISAGDNACGTCKIVKGSINPAGGCKLFVAKPV